MPVEQHTFFRPDELHRQSVTLPAENFNPCRLLLSRTAQDSVFVPIRSMQILGVISRDEVVFVDSLAYAVRDGEGGRVIVLAWKFDGSTHRDSLTQPVPISVVHYRPGQEETQQRLISEFFKATGQLLAAQHQAEPAAAVKVVSIAGRSG